MKLARYNHSVAKLLLAAILLTSCAPHKNPNLANLTVWHSNDHATLVRGKCSLCLQHGLRSKVTMTTAYFGYCSRGHTIILPHK